MLDIERYNPTSDYAELYFLYRDPLCRDFFRRIPPDLRGEDLLKIEGITSSQFYTLRDNDELIGFASVALIDSYSNSCQVGLILKSKYLQTGYGYQAGKVLAEFLFYRTTMRKLYGRILASRRKLAKAMEKSGMTLEGTHKESVYYQGIYQDELEYRMLKSEYEAKYGSPPCHF